MPTELEIQERRSDLHCALRRLNERIEIFAGRVAPLYVILNWRWHDATRPPDAIEIAKHLRDLAEKTFAFIDKGDLDSVGYWFLSSGGLTIRLMEDTFVAEFMVQEAPWLD